jgi:hypothetical protein
MESKPFRKATEAIEHDPTRKAVDAIGANRPSMGQFHLPALRLPECPLPDIPGPEESNAYQSARALMMRLADSIIQWRHQLPSDRQPAILAVLNGGLQIAVERLAEESFHGIRIEGKIDGNPCMVLAHQATVQLLCYIEKVEKEESRRSIGFIINGEEQQL